MWGGGKKPTPRKPSAGSSSARPNLTVTPNKRGSAVGAAGPSSVPRGVVAAAKQHTPAKPTAPASASAASKRASGVNASAAARTIAPVRLFNDDDVAPAPAARAAEPEPESESESEPESVPASVPMQVATAPVVASAVAAGPAGARAKFEEMKARAAALRAKHATRAADLSDIIGRTVDHQQNKAQQNAWNQRIDAFASASASAAPAPVPVLPVSVPVPMSFPTRNGPVFASPVRAAAAAAVEPSKKEESDDDVEEHDETEDKDAEAEDDDSEKEGEDDDEEEASEPSRATKSKSKSKAVSVSPPKTVATAAVAVTSPKSKSKSKSNVLSPAVARSPSKPESKYPSAGVSVTDDDNTETDANDGGANDENAAPVHSNIVIGAASSYLTPNKADASPNKLRLRPSSGRAGSVTNINATAAAAARSPSSKRGARKALANTFASVPADTDSARSSIDLTAPPQTDGFAIGATATTSATVMIDDDGRNDDGAHADIEMHIRSEAAARAAANRSEAHARAMNAAALRNAVASSIDKAGAATYAANAGKADPSGTHKLVTHFGEFVEGGKYPRVEDELIVKVDLLRRSNILNDDKFDFALVINSPPESASDAAAREAYRRERKLRKKQSQLHGGGARASMNDLALGTIEEKKSKKGGGRGGAVFATPPPVKSGGSSTVLNSLKSVANILNGGAVGAETKRPHESGGPPPRTIAQQIQERLIAAGLDVQREDSRVNHRYLLKLRAPPERLEEEAERMHLKMRLKRGGYCQFERSLRPHIQGVDENTLFRSSERQLIIDHILKSKVSDGGADVYCADFYSAIELAFPLHMYARQQALNESWVKYWKQKQTSTWSLVTGLFEQPLEHVSDYFGEQIAFYFAWFGFYTRWLLIPTVLGIILFASQLAQTTIDGPVVPFYCLAMAIWATLFIESWKRENTRLAYGWGVLNYEKNDEYDRPEYEGTARYNQHSGQFEKRSSRTKRYCKAFGVGAALLGMLGATSALMVYLFTTRDKYLENNPKEGGMFGFDILFVPMVWGFIIPISDKLYLFAAKKLNAWENWRTESSHTNHLIIKVMSFRFMNSFLALFYYAFADLGIARLSVSLFSFMIAGQMFNYVFSIGAPWAWHKIKVWRAEIKKDNIRKTHHHTATGNAADGGRAHARGRRRLSAEMKKEGLTDAWIQSQKPEYENFEDHCANVVQFAYVTLFSVAFPLAPLCALINNLVEMRADAYKLLNVCRRPVARRSGGIGVWLDVLQAVGVLAVLTNCALIGFTSTQLNTWFPRISSSDKILAIFIFEHILLILKLVARALIPEVPKSIQRKMAREKVELNHAKTQLINGSVGGAVSHEPHLHAHELNGAAAADFDDVDQPAVQDEDVAINIERSPLRPVATS